MSLRINTGKSELKPGQKVWFYNIYKDKLPIEVEVVMDVDSKYIICDPINHGNFMSARDHIFLTRQEANVARRNFFKDKLRNVYREIENIEKQISAKKKHIDSLRSSAENLQSNINLIGVHDE